MNLGTLIDTLAEMPADALVRFDAGDVPQNFCSWRGVYRELSLNSRVWTGAAVEMTAGRLLELAREANGGTFEGWKGGDYVMDRATAVWADDEGEYRCRGILGVSLVNDTVILQTADLSDYR